MLLINSHNSPFGDIFFRFMTELAEGWIWGLIILISLFIRYEISLMFTASVALSTLLSQLLKHTIFDNNLRPFAYFNDIHYPWHFVEGVFMNEYNSFPSGHTTSAFAIFTLVVLSLKNKNFTLFFLLIACLVGFSRNYLFQHFPEDVLGGSVLGMFSSVVCYVFLKNIFEKNTKSWHQKSLLRR
jgi:membrane-associated phospholipid phosphatase